MSRRVVKAIEFEEKGTIFVFYEREILTRSHSVHKFVYFDHGAIFQFFKKLY